MAKTYLKMRPNEIHNKLMKRIPEPEMRELMKDEIAKAKHAQKIERLSTLQHKRLWRELLSPLRYELSNARVGLRHQGRNLPERQHAFEAYIKIMERLSNKFTSMQLMRDEDDGTLMTPSEIAQELDIPNRGVHWTDWIPQSKKLEVTTLFEQIPHAPKTKRKVPFQRTQRPTTKLKERLLRRTLKELGNAETEYAISPTGVLSSQIAQMHEAIKRIEQLKPSDAVPHTWHGL
jgi:hypothetical protein